MANQKDERFKLRIIEGVDHTVNARVTSPGSWKILENLYMKEPGRLEQRPGTVEFVQLVVTGEASPDHGSWPGDGASHDFGLPEKLIDFSPEIVINNKFGGGLVKVQIPPIGTKVPGGLTFTRPTIGSVVFDASF
jgi:hypothetical protein